MIDECEFMKRCLDIKRLNQSEIEGDINEDLADQYEKLCTFAGGFGCSIRGSYIRADK